MNVFEGFERAFKRAWSASGTAPGRVNLIGEHIDYNGGMVLPTPLKNKTDVAIAANADDAVRIQSDRFEDMVERAVGAGKSGHWSDYVMGAIAQASQFGWAQGGFDLYIKSDVPDGAGVSSSAALVTAVLRALMIHADADLDASQLAMAARKVENEFIGVPCGIMDQMAVGLVDYGEALALDTAKVETDVIAIPPGWSFVTLHSGVHRKLSDGRYRERFEECAAATAALGTRWLCQLSDMQARQIKELPEALAKRARHAVSEHKRTLWAIGAMKAADATSFGKLMNESHASYSKDFEASTPEIDYLVKDAVAQGALGSRLTGGGFGGCVVSLLPSDRADAWTQKMLTRHPNAWQI